MKFPDAAYHISYDFAKHLIFSKKLQTAVQTNAREIVHCGKTEPAEKAHLRESNNQQFEYHPRHSKSKFWKSRSIDRKSCVMQF